MRLNEKEICLKIYHLYPDLLNLYGDRGNVLAFKRRCNWRDIEVEILPVGVGDSVDFREADFLFFGGGSDKEQNIIAKDLASKRDNFAKAIEDNLVVLAICGGLQLMGRYYLDANNKKISGLELLDLYTRSSEKRLIGDVVSEVEIEGKKKTIVGFENHGGRTYLGDLAPLGKIKKGYGNNGEDLGEGARYKNVFCSYLHGPILPKNSVLTDYLISLALKRRGYQKELFSLEDTYEKNAVKTIVKRFF